jgi:hypothetical protein
MKLRDVYITWRQGGEETEGRRTRPWRRGKVTVAAKALGVPDDVENFFDPDLWDQSNLAHLFAQWFTTLTIGHWEVTPMADPSQVYDELMKIDEFHKLMEGRILRKKKCNDLGKGDRFADIEEEAAA